ncbi:hypothetical protein DK295_15480, partial [Listeria monocytogenes]
VFPFKRLQLQVMIKKIFTITTAGPVKKMHEYRKVIKKLVGANKQNARIHIKKKSPLTMMKVGISDI